MNNDFPQLSIITKCLTKKQNPTSNEKNNPRKPTTLSCLSTNTLTTPLEVQ